MTVLTYSVSKTHHNGGGAGADGSWAKISRSSSSNRYLAVVAGGADTSNFDSSSVGVSGVSMGQPVTADRLLAPTHHIVHWHVFNSTPYSSTATQTPAHWTRSAEQSDLVSEQNDPIFQHAPSSTDDIQEDVFSELMGFHWSRRAALHETGTDGVFAVGVQKQRHQVKSFNSFIAQRTPSVR